MSLFKRALACMLTISLVTLPNGKAFAGDDSPKSISFAEFKKHLISDKLVRLNHEVLESPRLEVRAYLPGGVSIGTEEGNAIRLETRLLKDSSGKEEIGILVHASKETLDRLDKYKEDYNSASDKSEFRSDYRRSTLNSLDIDLSQYNDIEKSIPVTWAHIDDSVFDLFAGDVIKSSPMVDNKGQTIILSPKALQLAEQAEREEAEAERLALREQEAAKKRIPVLVGEIKDLCKADVDEFDLLADNFAIVRDRQAELAQIQEELGVEDKIDLTKEEEKLNNKEEKAFKKLMKKKVAELRKAARDAEDIDQINEARDNIDAFFTELASQDVSEKLVEQARKDLFVGWMDLADKLAYEGEVDSTEELLESTEGVFGKLTKAQKKDVKGATSNLSRAQKNFEKRQVAELAQAGISGNEGFRYAFEDLYTKYEETVDEACDYGLETNVNYHTTRGSFLGLRPYAYSAKPKYRKPKAGQVERCEEAKADLAEVGGFYQSAQQAEYLKQQYYYQQQQKIASGQIPNIPTSAAPWANPNNGYLPNVNPTAINAPGYQFPTNAAPWAMNNPIASAPQNGQMPFDLGIRQQQPTAPWMQQQQGSPWMQQQPGNPWMQQPMSNPWMTQQQPNPWMMQQQNPLAPYMS